MSDEMTNERDELLRTLLLEADALLAEPQVFVVAVPELRGQLALRDGQVDDEDVTQRWLWLNSQSVVCRAARDGVAYLGPVPESDPCVNVCAPELLKDKGVVVCPVAISDRTICVVLGHPRDRITRELRDQMLELTQAVSVELGKLISRMKQPAPQEAPASSPAPQEAPASSPAPQEAPAPSPAPQKAPAPSREVRGTTPYGHPAVRVEPTEPAKPQASQEDNVFQLTRRKAKPEPPPTERRSYPRFPLCVQVSHVSDHNFFTGFMEDLSEGGLFIASHNVFKVGHRFELEFALPGQPKPSVVHCEVRWVRVFETATELIPGMGVKFLDLAPETLEQIKRFMRKRPPLVCED